jgi:hypothetical protein
MRPLFRLFSISLVSVLAASALPAHAQPNPDIHQSLLNLADQPPTHTGFVFDRSLVQGMLQAGGLSSDRAAAAITSIAVDNYRYPMPAVYAPGTMNSILDAYHAAGWKHLVNAHEPSVSDPEVHRTATDLWLHFSGTDIDGVTVLTRTSRDMSVIQMACDLRPLDLVHLSGHFGIPKVDPNAVMVPAPDNH